MCFIGVVQLTSFRGIYKYMVIYIAVQIEPLILIHFFRSSKVKKNTLSINIHLVAFVTESVGMTV